MKFFLFLVLAVIGATADDVDVAGDVKDIIDKIVNTIQEPLIDIHDYKQSFDIGSSEHADLDIHDIVLSGIKNLDTTTLDYDKESGRLDYDLTLADINALVDFDLVLSGVFNVEEHHPVVVVTLGDLKFGGYAVVDTSSKPHTITDFKLLVTLAGAKVNLDNILNDAVLTEKLNNILNDQLVTIVNDVAVQLEPLVSPILKAVFNILIKLSD